eukprot:5415892-Pyramimonas_sp.AAC.2
METTLNLHLDPCTPLTEVRGAAGVWGSVLGGPHGRVVRGDLQRGRRQEFSAAGGAACLPGPRQLAPAAHRLRGGGALRLRPRPYGAPARPPLPFPILLLLPRGRVNTRKRSNKRVRGRVNTQKRSNKRVRGRVNTRKRSKQHA